MMGLQQSGKQLDVRSLCGAFSCFSLQDCSVGYHFVFKAAKTHKSYAVGVQLLKANQRVSAVAEKLES